MINRGHASRTLYNLNTHFHSRAGMRTGISWANCGASSTGRRSARAVLGRIKCHIYWITSRIIISVVFPPHTEPCFVANYLLLNVMCWVLCTKKVVVVRRSIALAGIVVVNIPTPDFHGGDGALCCEETTELRGLYGRALRQQKAKQTD